jgi:putative aldouronate transport system substrate-binding protein
MFGNQFNAYFVSEEQADANVWEETAKLNNSATPSVALGFSFNSEPVKTEMAQLAAVGEEQGELVTYGPDELSEALPALIEALKGAGAEKVQAEVQRQLDEWAKNKSS